LASAYRAKHNVSREDLKRAIAHVSVKSHANGSKNPKAHLRNVVTEEQVMAAPMIAEPLGLFDCCGVSDGAAAAIPFPGLIPFITNPRTDTAIPQGSTGPC
jgi:acetyl-CoA C-acetyltransferase